MSNNNLSIIKAEYGVNNRFIDVTNKIKEYFLKDNMLFIKNEINLNDIFTDPHYGFTKELRINALVNGKPIYISEKEKHNKLLNDIIISNNNTLSIIKAEYGVNNRFIDVTNKIKEYFLKDNMLFIKKEINLNDIFTDPNYGFTKELRINAVINDKPIYISEKEQNNKLLNDIIISKNHDNMLKTKKILHFVLYSRQNEIYRNMYKLTSSYYKKYNYNVTTIYYTFDNTINDEYKMEDDILLIKGEENFCNITIKTLKAFKFFSNESDNYEYIVRSNISTIINFKVLLNHLLNNKITYGGGNIMELQWLDEKSGITDDSLFGLKFSQGTCIILNQEIFKQIIKNENQLRSDIVDDLSISLFIKNIINIKNIDHVNCCNMPNFNGIHDDIFNFIRNDFNNIVVYRNNNRIQNSFETVDLLQMKSIIDIIQNKQIGFYTCFFGDNNNIANKICNINNSTYDYYYFTNNPYLYYQLKNTNWIRVHINVPIYNDLTLDSFSSKELKATPNKYNELNNYNYLCYFDSKIKINEERILQHINQMNHFNKIIVLSKHPFLSGNNGVFNEYYECIKQNRYYIEKDKYLNYINRQLSIGLSKTTQHHYTTNFIIRKKCLESDNINNLWYEHIKECGIECQISFFFIQQIYNNFLYTIEYSDGYNYF